MSFEIEYEYFRNYDDPRGSSNWSFAIDMLADIYGIHSPNKKYFLCRIARFRNPNFKKAPTDQELVIELIRQNEQLYRD